MNVEHWPTGQPIPYARNPRSNDSAVAKVKASIKEFGFRQPIVVDKDGVIVVGHTRHKVAIELGITEVPVVVASDLTPAQVKAYRLADNRTNEEATWIDDLLALELDELKLSEFDLALTGFSDDELSAYSALAGSTQNGLTDDDVCPEPPVIPKSKLGDIWILGNHSLMCGDSTATTDVQRLMDGEKADTVWTDPPYNVAYEGKTKDALRIENDSMDEDAFRQFLKDAFTSALAATKAGGAIYVAHADMQGHNFRLAFLAAGWSLRSCLVWAKNSLVLGRGDYQWRHEPILYGWAPGAAHEWHSDRKQTTVLEFDRPSRSAEHPTMKPVALIEYCLGNSCLPGQRVLDLFGGSGSTLIACEKTARKARLMEIDPKYCDVILKRWQDFTGKQAVHVDGTLFDKRD
jgi:DNA modification methylase